MSGKNKHFYEFDDYRLDAENHLLWRGGELVQIFPKALEILILLVEKKGEVVSRQELLENVWQDTFVEEANITYTVSQLRKTLGDKNYIQTVPKHGYRFTAPVKISGNGQPKFFTNTPITESDDAEKSFRASSLPPLRVSTASLVWFGIGVVSLLVFGFAVDKFLPKRGENKTSAPAETVRFQKLTFTGDIFYPVLAPDGKSFAYTRDGSIFLQEIGSETAVRVEVEDEKIFGFLQFAPDGNSIYFRNRRTIDLAGNVLEVSRRGGAARTVAEKVWSGFSFSPGGGEMAFIRFYPDENESALIVKNLESGAERKLVVRRSPNGFSYPNGFPAWSPDAKKIAVAVQNYQETPASEIVVIDAESADTEEIKTPGFRQIEQTAWTPDGASLLVVAREKDVAFQLWRVSIPSGEIRRITNDTNIYRALSLSADGTRILARQFTTYAHVWTAQTGDLENARQMTSGNLNRDGTVGLIWTADGNLIYATRILGNVDLWLLRPPDGSRRQLTENSGEYNEYPALSADGKHIFFISNRNGSRRIWQMDVNGENQTQITSGEGVVELYPAVSADGRWLYYLRRDGKETAVWRKSLTGDGQAEPLRIERKFSPDSFLLPSPDGKHLAFYNRTEKIDEMAERQTMQIVIVSTESASAAPKVFNLAVSPALICWTNGGATFDYVENSAEGAKIWRQSLDEKTPPQPVLTLPKEKIFRFAWSADGKNLALSRGGQQNDAVLLTNF